MNLFDELKNDVAGAKVLSDWLGSGGVPVSPDKAYSRALSCVTGDGGDPCPHNRAPTWLDTAKGVIADEIRKQLEIKTRLKISTPLDDKIFMCDICGCKLSLKVQVPIEHIAAHTSPDVKAKYPPYCWQHKELP